MKIKSIIALVLSITTLSSVSFAEVKLKPYPDFYKDRNVKTSYPMTKVANGKLYIDKTDKRFYKDIIESLNLSENTANKIISAYETNAATNPNHRTVFGDNSSNPYDIMGLKVDLRLLFNEVAEFSKYTDKFGVLLINNNENAVKAYWKFKAPDVENPDGSSIIEYVKPNYKNVSLFEKRSVKGSVVTEEYKSNLDLFSKYPIFESLVPGIIEITTPVKIEATMDNGKPHIDVASQEYYKALREPAKIDFENLLYVFKPYFDFSKIGMVKSQAEDFEVELEVGTLTAGYKAWQFKKGKEFYTLVLVY